MYALVVILIVITVNHWVRGIRVAVSATPSLSGRSGETKTHTPLFPQVRRDAGPRPTASLPRGGRLPPHLPLALRHPRVLAQGASDGQPAARAAFDRDDTGHTEAFTSPFFSLYRLPPHPTLHTLDSSPGASDGQQTARAALDCDNDCLARGQGGKYTILLFTTTPLRHIALLLYSIPPLYYSTTTRLLLLLACDHDGLTRGQGGENNYYYNIPLHYYNIQLYYYNILLYYYNILLYHDSLLSHRRY